MSDEWEPRKPGYIVALRRLKRRLKAAASVGLALAAGAFLILHDDDVRADSSPPPPKNKRKTSKRDKKKKNEGQQPDKTEHRKGMPVPDNLLE